MNPALSPARATQMTSPRKISKLTWWTREIAAFIIWLYIFTQLFVISIDRFLLSRLSPASLHILSYKPLFASIVVAAFLYLLAARRVSRKSVLYVIAYPIYKPLVWALKTALINHRLALLIAAALHELANDLSQRLTLFIIAASSALTILTASNYYFLVAGVTCMTICTFTYMIGSFKRAYRPSLFATLSRYATRFRASVQTGDFGRQLTNRRRSEGQEQGEPGEYDAYLSYTSLRTIEVLKAKGREFASSKIMDLFLILSLLTTVLLVIVGFSLSYFGLHKIDSSSFANAAGATYWNFLGYSLGTFMMSSISKMTPESGVAQLLSHLETLCELLAGAVLVFTVLTAARERHHQDLEALINELGLAYDAVVERMELEANTALDKLETLAASQNLENVNVVRSILRLPALEAVPANHATPPPASDPQNAPYQPPNDPPDLSLS